MTPACDIAVQEIGNGLSASLRGIDCLAGSMSEQAFGRLFGADGQLTVALTMILTIFVALFAFALLTGRANISIRSLVPRTALLGFVLMFATSYTAFQMVFPTLLIGAPDQIASILTGTDGSATSLFADKIDIVFAKVAEVASNQGQAGGAQDASGTFTPPNLLWLGALLFLLGTVGVLVTARIALGILLALGPVFIVLALFGGTRGLFVGWLKAAVLMSVAPLLAVLSGSLILEMTVPILSSLSPMPGEIDPRAAFAFFLIGFVHIALMIMAMRAASMMVGGWRVFGLADKPEDRGESGSTLSNAQVQAAPSRAAATYGAAAPAGNGSSAARRSVVASVTMPTAANDMSGGDGGRRETRIYATSHDQSSGGSRPATSRARGIGSRFRAAPARKSEFVK